jgi:hypothetical protein
MRRAVLPHHAASAHVDRSAVYRRHGGRCLIRDGFIRR